MIRKTFFGLAAFVIIAAFSPAEAQVISSQSGFGTTVAVAGDHVLVGEPTNRRIPGMLYVYAKSEDGSWMESQALSADDGHPEDHFGSKISVDGDRMIVGATRHDDERGAAYVFERGPEGDWMQVVRLQPDSVLAGDRFGSGLALDGARVYVAANPVEAGGKVYIFDLDEATGDWTETAVIQNDPELDKGLFGASLAVQDGALLVGSPATGNGVVYVYHADEEGTWSVSQTLMGRPGGHDDSSGSATSGFFGTPHGDMFGSVVHAENGVVLVTAPNYYNSTGLLHVFRPDPSGMYSSMVRLQPFDHQPRHLFARDVAFAGDELWIGSFGNEGYTGSIYAHEFDAETMEFEEAEKTRPDELGQATFFGSSIAANASVAVVGAPNDPRPYGSAYVYERLGDDDWEITAKLGSALQVSNASISGDPVKCDDGSAANHPCKNVDLISYVTTQDLGAPRGIVTNDVWGWTDSETGKEYALVGRTDATSFIDISDPGNPIVLGTLQRTEGSPVSVWRDMKVYKDHAFIVADGAGAHGMQIFDLTQLRNVENPPVEFEETARYDEIYSAHNIVINEETGFAYTVGNRSGGETCAGGSHMINIQDPTNPVFAGCFAHVETGRQGTGYTHDAQCVVYGGPDDRYTGREICFGANETAVSIADVTDKENPIAISTGNYPNPGYTHQGWLSDDHRYLFVNDELDEINGGTDGTRTLIWDVAELDDPILVNQHVSENKSSDHNLYIRGNYMYQSNYQSGLRIIDVSDVENPVEVGYFDTVNWGEDKPGFGGSWSNYPFFESGVIIVTSAEEGVFFVKRSDVDI